MDMLNNASMDGVLQDDYSLVDTIKAVYSADSHVLEHMLRSLHILVVIGGAHFNMWIHTKIRYNASR